MNKKPINNNPTKEFFSLLKTIEKNTKNQARISSYNPDDISSFVIEISPIKGVYQHAKFLFLIQLTLYPREFPNVICLSDIYHPNIEHGEDYHNVCLNLFDNWNRSFGLMDVIQGLIFLLYQPNLNDPISSFFNSKGTNDETFRKNVHTSLYGGVVDGIEFLPNPGIIEYNETLSKQKMISTEEEHNKTSVDINVPNDDNDCVENGNGYATEDSDKERNVVIPMENNNAVQDYVEEDVRSPSSDYEEESYEDLPTIDAGSPNAFYSDLICSRYAQPDKLSDSEYGCNNECHTSIPFNIFGFPSSAESPESELINAFDHYSGYTDDGDDDYDDIYDEYDDCEEEDEDDIYDDDDDDDVDDCVNEDSYISVPHSPEDPSYPFLSKWFDIRRLSNRSHSCPSQMTSIILTNVLSPARPIVGTFLMCRDYRSWYENSLQAVCRVSSTDTGLHLLALAHNLCLRLATVAGSTRTPLATDMLLWHSLSLGLAAALRVRLACLHNYGRKDDFECIFVR